MRAKTKTESHGGRGRNTHRWTRLAPVAISTSTENVSLSNAPTQAGVETGGGAVRGSEAGGCRGRRWRRLAAGGGGEGTDMIKPMPRREKQP